MPRFVLVLLLLWAGCASSQRFLSPAPPVEHVAVARYEIFVEGLEADVPQAATGLLPGVVEAVQAVRAARETVEALRNPTSSPWKAAYDSAYAVIAKALVQDLGLPLLPLDTLRGMVPYVWGYPMGTPHQVARSGAFDAALSIRAEVTVPGSTSTTWFVEGSGGAHVRARPVVTVRVELVAADGQLLWRDAAKVRPRETLELTERWFLGIRTNRDVQASATLPDLVREAVQQLVEQQR